VNATSDSNSARGGPLPPVLFFAALALVVGLHLLVPVVQLFTWPLRVAAGGVLLAAGIALNLWADSLFKRVGTSVKPFEPTTALIVGGPFAFSRHPMYLGMVLILIGSALALGSLSPWVVVPVFVSQITRRFIVAEEAKLRLHLARATSSTSARYAAGSKGAYTECVRKRPLRTDATVGNGATAVFREGCRTGRKLPVRKRPSPVCAKLASTKPLFELSKARMRLCYFRD